MSDMYLESQIKCNNATFRDRCQETTQKKHDHWLKEEDKTKNVLLTIIEMIVILTTVISLGFSN